MSKAENSPGENPLPHGDPTTRLAVDNLGNLVRVTDYPDGTHTEEIEKDINVLAALVREAQTLHVIEHGTVDEVAEPYVPGNSPNLDVIREKMGHNKLDGTPYDFE